MKKEFKRYAMLIVIPIVIILSSSFSVNTHSDSGVQNCDTLPSEQWKDFSDSLNSALQSIQKIDWEKINKSVKEAMAQIDLKKMQAEINESLKSIKWDQIEKSVKDALKQINSEKIQTELRESLKQAQKEVKRSQEQLQLQQNKDLENAKKELEKNRMEIERLRKELNDKKNTGVTSRQFLPFPGDFKLPWMSSI